MTARTAFRVLWQHDGARELEVIVEADLPPFGPMENRIRSIASITSSHGGLRRLLEDAYADRWTVTVLETVGAVTTVRLVPLSPPGRAATRSSTNGDDAGSLDTRKRPQPEGQDT